MTSVPRVPAVLPEAGTQLGSDELSYSANMDADVDHFLLDQSCTSFPKQSSLFGHKSDLAQYSGSGSVLNSPVADDFDLMPQNEKSSLSSVSGGNQDPFNRYDDTESMDINATEERLPVISREGLRKKRSAMLAPDRLRKSRDQVTYLTRLYQMTGGKLDRRQRKQATKLTGLSWIQIYKWLFDKQLKDNKVCLS